MAEAAGTCGNRMEHLCIRRPNGDLIRVPFADKITIKEVKKHLCGLGRLQRLVMGDRVLEDDYELKRSDLLVELLLVISGAEEEVWLALEQGDAPALRAALELHPGDEPRILQSRNSRGCTAFLSTVYAGNREQMRVFLERGPEEVHAMLQECDDDGNAALHVAAARGDRVFIEEAMEAMEGKTKEGIADLLGARNEKGQMPFDAALASNAPASATNLFRRSTEAVCLRNARTLASLPQQKLPQKRTSAVKGKADYAQLLKLSRDFLFLLTAVRDWAEQQRRAAALAPALTEELGPVIERLTELDAAQRQYQSELKESHEKRQWANIEDSPRARRASWFTDSRNHPISEQVGYLYHHKVKPFDHLVRRRMEGLFEGRSAWREELRRACEAEGLCVVQQQQTAQGAGGGGGGGFVVLFSERHKDKMGDYFVDQNASTVECERDVIFQDIARALPEMEEPNSKQKPSSHFVVAAYMFDRYQQKHGDLKIGHYMQLVQQMIAREILGWRRMKVDQNTGDNGRKEKLSWIVPYPQSDEGQRFVGVSGAPVTSIHSEDGRAVKARLFALLLAHGGRMALTRIKTEYRNLFNKELREDLFGSSDGSRRLGQLSELVREMWDVLELSSKQKHTSHATVFTPAFHNIITEKVTDLSRSSAGASLMDIQRLLAELIDEQKCWLPMAQLSDCEDAKSVFQDRICTLPAGLATARLLLQAPEMRELQELLRE